MSLATFPEFRNSHINQCHTVSPAVGHMKDESVDLFTQTKYQLGYRDRHYNPFLISHRNKKTISTELFFRLDSFKDIFLKECVVLSVAWLCDSE